MISHEWHPIQLRTWCDCEVQACITNIQTMTNYKLCVCHSLSMVLSSKRHTDVIEI